MITEQQEQNLADSLARSKKKQDRTNPMVINIDDLRLMPNTPRLRVHAKYRVYSGPIDASKADRQRWLDGALRHLPRKVINSAADEPPFDIGTASKDDLVTFAMENFGTQLEFNKPLKALREEVLKLAELEGNIA